MALLPYQEVCRLTAMLWDLSPHTETLLAVFIAAIPNIILAMAAYKKVGRQNVKIDKIQKQTNGNLVQTTNRMNDLARRLSKYEQLPEHIMEEIHDARNPESGGGNRGGSDAG